MSFNLFRFFKKKKKPQPQEPNYRFKWLEPLTDKNPFNKKVLDIRAFTWNIIVAPDDENLVKKYTELRSIEGEEYIDKSIEDAEAHDTYMEFPHNGSKIEGILYKSESMNIKWDIYTYQKVIYFTNSWTGKLIYKAYLDILESKNVAIRKIEYPKTIGFEIANSAIYYLIKSHIEETPFPHRVPMNLKTEIEIAHYSSEQYGSKACYACYEDVTDITLASDNNNV